MRDVVIRTENDVKSTLGDFLISREVTGPTSVSHRSALLEAVYAYETAWEGLLSPELLQYRVGNLRDFVLGADNSVGSVPTFPGAEKIEKTLQFWSSNLGHISGLFGVNLPWKINSKQSDSRFSANTDAAALAAVFNYMNSVRDEHPIMLLWRRLFHKENVLDDLRDDSGTLYPLFQPLPTVDALSVKDVAVLTLAGVLPIGAAPPFFHENYDSLVPIWNRNRRTFSAITEFLFATAMHHGRSLSGTRDFTEHDIIHYQLIVGSANSKLNHLSHPFLTGLEDLTANGTFLHSLDARLESSGAKGTFRERLTWGALIFIAHERENPFTRNWSESTFMFQAEELKSCLSSGGGVGSFLFPLERRKVQFGLADEEIDIVCRAIWETAAELQGQ